MSFVNKIIKAEVMLDGRVMVADVNLDWVDHIVYINNVVYEKTDIKSILSDIIEEALEENLTAYCIQRGL